MNRRSFLKTAAPKSIAKNQAVTGASSVQSGLSAYNGAWTINEVTHLLKRTMFGAKKADVDYFLTLTPGDAVDELLNNIPTVTPPLRDYGLMDSEDGMFDDPTVVQGQTWINTINNVPDFSQRATIDGNRLDSIRKWWVGLMIHQNRSIWEKMILFWHHHFSVQKEEVPDATMMYRHHNLLRTNALGNVRQLTKDITIDPAMLFHLNGYLNSELAPDENYARELQELFTVGTGPNSLYTEDDVIAAARVLTGWRVHDQTWDAYVDAGNHDTGNKSFSSFYNNTTITGSADAKQEIGQFINMIFATEESSKYFCRKLYRWFVYSNIDENVEAEVITPLAEIFRNNNFEVKPVLLALLKSEHFFDSGSMACHIKSPYDFIIGTLREFNVTFPAYTDYQNGYPLFNGLYRTAKEMQQDLFQPPDVSGWAAYHQEPMFYDLWVNSNSLPRSADFTDQMFRQNLVDVRAFAINTSDPADPNQLISDATASLLSYPLSENSRNYIKNKFLLNNVADDTIWTNAWNSSNFSLIDPALNKMFAFITNLPEFHLS